MYECVQKKQKKKHSYVMDDWDKKKHSYIEMNK